MKLFELEKETLIYQATLEISRLTVRHTRSARQGLLRALLFLWISKLKKPRKPRKASQTLAVGFSEQAGGCCTNLEMHAHVDEEK